MSSETVSTSTAASMSSAASGPLPTKSTAKTSAKTTPNIQSDKLIEIFKSRKIIIEHLEGQKYDVSQYKDFGINDVNTLIQTKQLDMLMTKQPDNKQVYIKYHLTGSLRSVNIYDYIDDLFNLEDVLKKKDDLIVIIKDEPNETILKTLINIWEQDGIFVSVMNIKRLQYNVMQHSLVPPHIVLSQEEAEAVKLRYNITSNAQIPDISRFSPVSQAIGLRPNDLCQISRPSKTAIKTEFYRICNNK